MYSPHTKKGMKTKYSLFKMPCVYCPHNLFSNYLVLTIFKFSKTSYLRKHKNKKSDRFSMCLDDIDTNLNKCIRRIEMIIFFRM